MACIGFLRMFLSWRGEKKSTFSYSQILPFKILPCIEVIFGIYVATFCRSKDRIRNACFFFYVELHRNTFFFYQIPFMQNHSHPTLGIHSHFAAFLICSVRRSPWSRVAFHRFLVDEPFFLQGPVPCISPQSLVSWCPDPPISVSLNPSAHPCV